MTDAIDQHAALLTLRAPRVSFATLPGLEAVSITLRRGDVVAVVGPSGSGKSTCLRVAAGLDEISGGERSLAPCRTAFVFQDGGLVSNLSVLENLLLPLQYQGRPFEAARQRAMLALSHFGVYELKDERPGRLSKETRVCVQLARAFAVEPDLVFLDEAFLRLSRETLPRVAAWLTAITTEHKAGILLASTQKESVAFLDPVFVEWAAAHAPTAPRSEA